MEEILVDGACGGNADGRAGWGFQPATAAATSTVPGGMPQGAGRAGARSEPVLESTTYAACYLSSAMCLTG